jgi:hypothetical protein
MSVVAFSLCQFLFGVCPTLGRCKHVLAPSSLPDRAIAAFAQYTGNWGGDSIAGYKPTN